MIIDEFTINYPFGMHYRPCYVMAKCLSEFKSTVKFIHNGRLYNAKNTQELYNAHLVYGDTITVRIEGSDEQETYAHFSDLIELHAWYLDI